MSISLLLQDENKKTLGGYLFVMFLSSSLISSWIFETSFENIEITVSFISFLLTIATFLSLAFITIRPEKWVEKWIIGTDKIPPFFVASKDLTIRKAFSSSYLSKDKDEFWGTFLVGIGFVVAMFIPMSTIYQSDIVVALDLIKFFLFFVISVYIFFDLYKVKMKSLRNRVEIVWRFFSIISHDGWKDYFSGEIAALEESIKLRLWLKAKYQINELELYFRMNVNEIPEYLHYGGLSLRFLLGDHTQYTNYKKFGVSYSSKADKCEKAIILGLDYTHIVYGPIIIDHLDKFSKLEKKYKVHISTLGTKFNDFLNPFRNNTKDWNLIYDFFMKRLDSYQFHLKNPIIEIPEFDRIKELISKHGNDEIKDLIENVKSPLEFYQRITKKERNLFNQEREIIYKSSDFDHIREKLELTASDISIWLMKQSFLDYSFANIN